MLSSSLVMVGSCGGVAGDIGAAGVGAISSGQRSCLHSRLLHVVGQACVEL